MLRRWRRVVILVLALASIPAVGGEARISLALDGQAAHAALGLAARLGAGEQEIDPEESSTGAGAQPVVLCLADASAATVRQAFAHALERWWAITPSGAVRYQRAATLPAGALSTRVHTSGLVRQPDAEARIRTLLVPWLTPAGAGLAYEAGDGLWSATLDGGGHARLIEALGVLERAPAPCPSLVADPEQPTPTALLGSPVLAVGWADLARQLATGGARLSVSCAAGLPARPLPITLTPGRLIDLPAQLAAYDVRAAILHGVLCIGIDAPVEREHPARRRRVTLVPVPHLVSRPIEGEVLVDAIRRQVSPAWWRLPGAAIDWLPQRGALLVAADAVTIHAVLDFCDRVDLLGFDAALDARAGR